MYRESFTERWAKTCSQHQLKDEDPELPSSMAGGGGGGTPKGGGSSTPRASAGGGNTPREPKKKKPVLEAFSKAKKVMASAQAAQTAARAIQSAMVDPSNTEWDWVSEKSRTSLDNTIMKLDQKVNDIMLAKLISASYTWEQ
eukprot:196077-Pyramimonas_sp.AAC.1